VKWEQLSIENTFQCPHCGLWFPVTDPLTHVCRSTPEGKRCLTQTELDRAFFHPGTFRVMVAIEHLGKTFPEGHIFKAPIGGDKVVAWLRTGHIERLA
jgi:hypothetical protein